MLITGAASGIGAALARRLAARGERLAPVDLREGPLAVIARELGAVPAPADVRDRDGLTAAIAGERAGLGGLLRSLAGQFSRPRAPMPARRLPRPRRGRGWPTSGPSARAART